MELDSFDIASLEWFRTDLVSSEFEPVPGTDRRLWRGPVHPAFSDLTQARTMDIVLDRGWPYRPPRVYVQGLTTNHSTLDGFVCLWREGDASLQWETLDGLFRRIEHWCKRAKNGWEDDDLPFDAYLNFKDKWPVMATFEFGSLRTGVGSWGDLVGQFTANPDVLNLRSGISSSAGELSALWFRVGQLRAPPPRNFSELAQHLNRPQRKGLQRAVSRRRSPTGLRPSGGVDIILFAWEWRDRPHLLVMALAGIEHDVEAAVLMAEPNDEQTLKLRAGARCGNPQGAYSCSIRGWRAGRACGSCACRKRHRVGQDSRWRLPLAGQRRAARSWPSSGGKVEGVLRECRHRGSCALDKG